MSKNEKKESIINDEVEGGKSYQNTLNMRRYNIIVWFQFILGQKSMHEKYT